MDYMRIYLGMELTETDVHPLPGLQGVLERLKCGSQPQGEPPSRGPVATPAGHGEVGC